MRVFDARSRLVRMRRMGPLDILRMMKIGRVVRDSGTGYSSAEALRDKADNVTGRSQYNAKPACVVRFH
jgi:hypothetical protein